MWLLAIEKNPSIKLLIYTVYKKDRYFRLLYEFHSNL